MAEKVRMVDLFCGCGGLSLGFELYKDASIEFESVLALDIDQSAVRCFNANTRREGSNQKTARICDLTWFNTEAEFLLYYLLHYAQWMQDTELKDELFSKRIGVPGFLATLRRSDIDYDIARQELIRDSQYREGLRAVDEKVFSLAICKSYFDKLGLSLPIGEDGLKIANQAWIDEYEKLDECPKFEFENAATRNAIENFLNGYWDSELKKLQGSSGKTAWGLNAPVPERIRTLVSFLSGKEGKRIKAKWLKWRTNRDTARAVFSNNVQNKLRELYTGNRKVQLVLGGPPCKGFSRIGRPVINRLKDQGTYSWASDAYGDERNALLYRYVLVLSALKPNIFVFENVENFKSPLEVGKDKTIDPPALLEEAIENLSGNAIHYHIRAKVLQASEYAVPQRRLRYIMIGFDAENTDDRAPEEFFKMPRFDREVPLKVALDGLGAPETFVFGVNNASASHKTDVSTYCDNRLPEEVKAYIRWIRQTRPGGKIGPAKTDAHIVRGAREDDLGLIRIFAPGKRWMDYNIKKSETLEEIRKLLEKMAEHSESCENSDLPNAEEIKRVLKKVNSSLALRLLIEDISLPLYSSENHLLTGGYLERGSGRHGDWFQRLDAMKPSKTIVAHIGKDTYGYIHPFEDRAISMREAARIQSFPDFFEFGTEGIVGGYSLIGNAVPPLLAYQFAKRLIEMQANFGVFSSESRKDLKKSKPKGFARKDQIDIPFKE